MCNVEHSSSVVREVVDDVCMCVALCVVGGRWLRRVYGENRVVSLCVFFFSSRRRHTRLQGDWSSDVCSSDLPGQALGGGRLHGCVSRGKQRGVTRRRLAPSGSRFGVTLRAARRLIATVAALRSEERRVGKEGRSRWSPYH